MKALLASSLTDASAVSQVGSEYTFTVRDPSTVKGIAFGVSYDAFIDDVQAGLLALWRLVTTQRLISPHVLASFHP